MEMEYLPLSKEGLDTLTSYFLTSLPREQDVKGKRSGVSVILLFLSKGADGVLTFVDPLKIL